MPKLKANASWYVALRFGAWLDWQQRRLKWSNYRLGKVLGGVQASRVKSWLIGARAISPETAFDYGQRLARAGSEFASGPLALFACGFFADYLKLLQRLGSMLWDDGNRLAVTLYCGTPHALAWLDEFGGEEVHRRAMDKMFASGRGLTRTTYRESTYICGNRRVPRSLITDLRNDSSSEAILRSYDDAWEQTLRDEPFADESFGYEINETPYDLDPEDDEPYKIAVERWLSLIRVRPEISESLRTWALERPRGMGFTPGSLLQWFQDRPSVLRTKSQLLSALPQPGNWTLDEAECELLGAFERRDTAIGVIDYVIEYAATKEAPYLMFTAPRAWRMLTEWAVLLDERAFRKLRRFIPPAYRPIW